MAESGGGTAANALLKRARGVADAAGDVASIELLVSHGANPNLQSPDGSTPLISAVRSVRVACRCARGSPPARSTVAVAAPNPATCPFLRVRSMQGQIDTVEALLARGADPALVTRDGTSAISVAEERCDPAMLGLLERHRNARTVDGVLAAAQQARQREALEVGSTRPAVLPALYSWCKLLGPACLADPGGEDRLGAAARGGDNGGAAGEPATCRCT